MVYYQVVTWQLWIKFGLTGHIAPQNVISYNSLSFLFATDVDRILQQHNINYHCSTTNIQMYLSFMV